MICVYYANSSVNSRFPGIIEQVLPRGVMQTLEKLELDKFAIDPHDIQHQINLPMASIPTTSVFNMARYPAVRSLSVGSFEGKPLLDHLQHLFPALDGTLHFGWFDMRYREDSYAGIRDINQRSQESDRDGSDSPLRGWKKLDRIICSASTLYVLGLRCPIRLAMINCEGVEKYRYAADALRENPVARLKLTLYHEPGMFDGLFSPELAETLKHLTLCLLYSNNYPLDTDAAPRLQWDTLLAMLVSAIQPLKGLTHLRVVVGASVFVHKEASWPFAPWEEYAHSLRGSRFDYQGTAAALTCALPSLHYVLLTTGGFLSNWDEEGGRWKPYERWYISRAWRVGTPGNEGVPDGERKLVELHGDVAETIIRKEELVLSRSDEHRMVVFHTLPIEILEAIIDQTSDHAESLRRLSLTCKDFLPRARYHLFSTICIRNLQQMEASREFFDSHPWIVRLVQQVTLSVAVGDLDDESALNNPNIRVLDVVPVHLLSKLPSLRSWRMKTVPHLPSQVSLSLHRYTLSSYKKHGDRIKDLGLEMIPFDDILDFVGLISAFQGLDSLTCESLRFRTPRARDFQDQSDKLVGSLKIKRLLCSSVSADRYGLDRSICQAIRCATSILDHVGSREHLTDVCVVFEVSAIGRLGFCLSPAGTSWKECKALEDALLAFPYGHILLKDFPKKYRAGRVEFWAPAIERAFPRLAKRGLLTFPSTKADWSGSPGHELPVQCICASYDNRHVVTASGDGTIIVWDHERGTIAHEWLPHGGHGVLDLALSPHSPRLVSASGGGSERLAVWDFGLNGTQNVATLEGHTETVTACAWSPDGTLIASASGDGTVRIWDALTFEQRGLLDDSEAVSDPRSLQFSPDSRHLAWISKSPTNDYTCVLWQPLESDERQPMHLLSHPTLHTVPVNALAFDPHSMRLATAHGSQSSRTPEECVVRIWDVVSGAALAVLSGHARQVNDVVFSPGAGSLVLSAASDGTVRLWDAALGVLTVALDIIPGTSVLKACFSPDGEFIATATSNLKRGPVIVWRTRDGACMGLLAGHRLRVHHMAFSPNGEFLTTGDVQGVAIAYV
ncbi:transporter [Ganoderma sinense ZZ0214-1]|uniref:Transporter n=1 Tax=Ganoderma sinense ZZ0214-1 TaxID=1077348 RepID=A0A2G8S8J7_9APHY|nr:transporter [Ganoderma sinense ZZ0214-1]